MSNHFARCLLVLAIGICSTAQGFGQDKVEPKKTDFQETANMLLGGCAPYLVEYGHLPHFTSFSRFKSGDFDFDADFRKKCLRFPDDLIKALGNQNSADHETAVFVLATYASLARNH